jgi:hypothetical protein
MSEKFPQPWQIIHCGPGAFVVLDANDRRLFCIQADEGDGVVADGEDDEDLVPPTVLYWSDDATDDDALMSFVARRLITKVKAPVR